MKDLNTYIKEVRLSDVRRTVSYDDNYHPKDRDELMDLLGKLIHKRGYDGDFNDIDTGAVTDMHELFANTSFNGNVSKWDVSNVKDMSRMFYNTRFFGDLSKWDVDKDCRTFQMFDYSPRCLRPPKWFK